MDFDQINLTLLTPITVGDKLKFKSNKTGNTYDAKPEHTLLAGEEIGVVHSMSKYKNTIRTTAFDPTNPRIEKPCPKCKAEIVSYQRLGDDKKVIYACVCGNIWT